MQSFEKSSFLRFALAAGLIFSFPMFTMNSASAKKEKYQEGIDEQFKGIMSVQNTVSMQDPLWERYAFAGKRAMERRDIDRAQREFWAACFQLITVSKADPTGHVTALARNIAQDLFSLSNDVFFQDPNPKNIQSVPENFPQEVMEPEKGEVDAQLRKLSAAQIEFDKQHPDFDGGARLRLVHLRRRIEFCTLLLPIVRKMFGPNDPVTRTAQEAFDSDSAEFKDVANEG